MSAKISAGLLMYRHTNKKVEVFLVHPGGPFFAHKHEASWDIPKGEKNDGEDLFDAAKREFTEETGVSPKPDVIYKDLGFVTNHSGKKVYVWAFEDGDFDPAKLVSNTFQLEWPPKSGKIVEFPENDKGDYFTLDEAEKLIYPFQKDFLSRLQKLLLV